MSKNGAKLNQFANLASFAEYMLVHEHAVVKIRPEMPLDRAALIGCGVTTGVGAVIHTAKVEPGATVVVIGCGGIGLSCINGAAIAGAGRIIAVDTVPSKLDLALKFGATDVVNAKQTDPVEAVTRTDRRRRALHVRSDRPEGDGRAGVQDVAPRRHRDGHRHDSAGSDGRSPRRPTC